MIQVRTTLQHAWAELSEKYADVIDPTIKYGGGPEETQSLLLEWSRLVERLEDIELNSSLIEVSEIEGIKSGIRRAIEGVIGELKRSTE